jgi:hypothetical protein
VRTCLWQGHSGHNVPIQRNVPIFPSSLGPWLSLSLFSFILAANAYTGWQGKIVNDIWALPPSAAGALWLVIHNLGTAAAEGMYHVEVLERARGAEPWRVKHLAKHMAVTEAALRTSVITPLKKGAVYPESFDAAYAEGKTLSAQGKAPVCRSSVIACVK